MLLVMLDGQFVYNELNDPILMNTKDSNWEPKSTRAAMPATDHQLEYNIVQQTTLFTHKHESDTMTSDVDVPC